MKPTLSSRLIHYFTKPIHWITHGSTAVRSLALFCFICPAFIGLAYYLCYTFIPEGNKGGAFALLAVVIFAMALIYSTEKKHVLIVQDLLALKPQPVKPVLQSELTHFMAKAKQARSFEELEFYCQTLRLTSRTMLAELKERKVKMEESIEATASELAHLSSGEQTPFRVALRESHQKTADFLATARVSVSQVICDATDMADYLEATLTGLEAKANVGRMLEICTLFSQMHSTYRALGITNDFDTDVKHVELELQTGVLT